MANLLFVCSKNQWRSPTAEALFKNHPLHYARSAGTSDKARVKVNRQILEWADIIFVMENKHRDMLKQRFGVSRDKMIVLYIEDEYQFADEELIQILKISLKNFLNDEI